ncbi:MAG: hypothetical protein WEA10_04395 [Actinomycetota bacterium]
MRIEFARRSDPADGDAPAQPPTLGTAVWTDHGVELEGNDDDARGALERIFRPTPVATDDGSYRRFGTHGDAVLQPGTFEWFRAAAFTRAPTENLAARMVPAVKDGAGWDPAAQYRTFEDVVERLESPRG